MRSKTVYNLLMIFSNLVIPQSFQFDKHIVQYYIKGRKGLESLKITETLLSQIK